MPVRFSSLRTRLKDEKLSQSSGAKIGSGSISMSNGSDTKSIEIRLVGKGLEPGNTKASDLADLLKSIEEMISGIVYKSEPQLSKEEVIVGLINILPGSILLRFTSGRPYEAYPAFEKIAYCVAQDSFKDLPIASLRSLHNITEFARKKSCVAQFVRNNGQDEILAEIRPETKIELPQMLKGETVIYGQIIRVGGRTPRVMIEMTDGQTVFCETSQEIAKSLGTKLYLHMGLRGVAQWDPETFRVEEFQVDSVIDFPEYPISKTIEELSSAVSKYFSPIENVEQYIHRIRAEDREE